MQRPYRQLIVTKHISAVLAALLLCAGCDKHQTPIAPTSEAAKPALTREQRVALVKSATAGMTEERDKMESISFYSTKDEPWIGTGITVYLSVPDDARPLLRVVPHYHGDSWIFFTSVKVMADGKIVYDRSFDGLHMKHDNNVTGVYESVDYAAQADDVAAVRAMASAKNVTVRLAGEKREDVDLAPADIARAKRVISAYDGLAAL